MTQPIELDEALLEGAPTINMSRRGLVCGLAAGTVFPFVVSGCTTNPYTGEQELNFFGEAQIAEMAATAWSDLKSQTPQSSNPQLREAVLRTWNRIEKVTPKAGEQWDVAVFDTDDVNAFVMPGNRVGVYRGIVDLSENEDQLSAVLGHEVGHSVCARVARVIRRPAWR